LLVSELTGFLAEEAMKTAGRENPNRWGATLFSTAPGAGGSEQILLNHVGREADETAIRGEVFFFFLTSPFIEGSLEKTVPEPKGPEKM